jgi:hypothetical protein
MSKNKLQRKPKNVWSGNITNIEENSNIKKWFEEVSWVISLE